MSKTVTLTLDVSDYDATMENVGKASEDAFNRISNACAKASQGVAEAGRQVKSLGDEFRGSLGNLSFLDKLNVGFAALQTGIGVAAGAMDAFSAHSKLSAAEASGSYNDVLNAQLGVIDANKKLLDAVPLLGPIIARTFSTGTEAINEQINALKKEQEQVADIHAEAEVNAAKVAEESPRVELALYKAEGHSPVEVARKEESQRRTSAQDDIKIFQTASEKADAAVWDKEEEITDAYHKLFPSSENGWSGSYPGPWQASDAEIRELMPDSAQKRELFQELDQATHDSYRDYHTLTKAREDEAKKEKTADLNIAQLQAQAPAKGGEVVLPAQPPGTASGGLAGAPGGISEPVRQTNNITVNPPANMDVRELARKIVDLLPELIRRGHGQ